MQSQAATPPGRPLPVISDLNRPMLEGADDKLRLQFCPQCGRWVFYPRIACPSCLNMDLKWREASGKGHVIAQTVVHRVQHPALAHLAPAAMVAVELHEGPVVIASMAGGENVPGIGSEVVVVMEEFGPGVHMPSFQVVS